MGVHFWTLPTMKLLHLFISIAAVSSAPAPQDEDVPAAVPYVHEEIEALPYVHEEIEAEPYVHEEPAPAVAPVVTYAAFPHATHAYTIPVAAAAKAESKSVEAAPVAYAYAAPLVYAAHTGCV